MTPRTARRLAVQPSSPPAAVWGEATRRRGLPAPLRTACSRLADTRLADDLRFVAGLVVALLVAVLFSRLLDLLHDVIPYAPGVAS